MKKIIALLMALSMVFALVACSKDKKGEDTSATVVNVEEELGADSIEKVTDPYAVEQTEEPASEVVTEVVEVTGADGEALTDADGEAVTETKTEVVTKKPTTTKAPAKKPETKAEVVNYFNEVMNDAKAKATTIEQLYVTNYLGGTSVIEGAVIKGIYNTLGGDKWLDGMLLDNSQNDPVTLKGADIKAKFPVENESWASKLTVDDVESATCTESKGIYTITIKTKADAKTSSIAHGEGHNPKVFNIALPEVINENIPGAAQGIVGSASMEYPSGTIVIQVSATANKVITADYDVHWTINFDKMGVVLPLATRSSYKFGTY